MFETMRRVFGPAAVATIIGAIALVFVFYGVFNPRGTKGLHAGAMAASVNGDGIPLTEFAREYQQRIDFYQNMMKGKVDVSQLKQLGLHQQVLEELIRRKLIIQEAKNLGMEISDDEVRLKIQEMPYFKKDGVFSAKQYEQVLQANRRSPAEFEDLIREDLLRARMVEFIRGRARVSEKEVEKEFLATEDRRQVEYVLISRESAKKALVVTEKEISDLLSSESGQKAAKAYYEQNKLAYLKTDSKKDLKKKPEDMMDPSKLEFKSFDDVKREVAIETIKERRADEIVKINREVAKELLEKAKNSPEKLSAAAKSRGLEVKTSEKFNRLVDQVPGLGEVPELVGDAFSPTSPLEKGPKTYESHASIVLARNLKSFKGDMSQFSKDKEKLMQQATSRKEQALLEQWMTEVRSKAKVTINKSVEEI